jgi:MFS family permease
MKAFVVTSDIPPDSPPVRFPKAVVRLGWVSFLTDVSTEMIVPLLPAFLATLPGNPARALGWIEGIAETTASATKVLSGRWADRAKAKKPLVLAGYGLSSVVRPLVGLAPTWPVVAVIRFFDRIGKGIRTAPRDTMIAAAAPAASRGAAFGLHRAFDNAGAVLGPLLAALLVGTLGLSFRAVFLLAAIPGLLSLLVLGFLVREKGEQELEGKTNQRISSKGPEGTAGRGSPVPPLPPRFWRVAGVVGFFTLAVSSDTFILLRAREIGVAAAWLPVLWAFSNGVKSLFSTWGGALSDRHGRRSLPASAGFGWIWVRYGSGTAFLAAAGIAATAAAALLVLVPERRGAE